MNKIKDLYKKIEKLLSSLKFAVCIITVFTLVCVYGTFMESYHGADYASRLVYRAWWFLSLQFLMFVSIVMAVVVRLPPKKRLYGFYTIHSGLVILFIGSLFTYIVGIDGVIQIIPNTPANKIIINRDFVKLSFSKTNTMTLLPLPYTAGPVKVNKEIKSVLLKEFYPFAEKQIDWVDHTKLQPQLHSSQYQLFNENMSQEFTLSLDPKSDFKSSMKLGLLSIHYMPSILKSCMVDKTESNIIIWNLENGECFTPEKRKIKVELTPKKTRFLVIDYKGTVFKFFPDFSPVAVNDDLTKNENSPFRILSRNIFEQKPHLFLFGESLAYYNKRKKSWLLKDLKEGPIKTPWMNFQVRLLKHSSDSYPVEVPRYVVPVMDNNELLKGGVKALRISFNGQDFWARNDGPLEITNGSDSIKVEIVAQTKALPYQITLDRFVMNKDPGTNNPASFESYVHLLDGNSTEGLQKHHIFMNNPLKYDDFTFYQSSYFPIGPNEQYGSVLSVNYDPGRFFKYLGSLLIVLGSMWHFRLNRRKKVKKNV